MSKEKRFQVRDSDLHYGKYVVLDIETNEIWRFHNLASAKTTQRLNLIKEQESCFKCYNKFSNTSRMCRNISQKG